jgi:hypothetical protein
MLSTIILADRTISSLLSYLRALRVVSEDPTKKNFSYVGFLLIAQSLVLLLLFPLC